MQSTRLLAPSSSPTLSPSGSCSTSSRLRSPSYALVPLVVPLSTATDRALPLPQFLYLCGASSLTALVDHVSCGNASETFSRCNVTKGLVAIGCALPYSCQRKTSRTDRGGRACSWIETIWVFLILLVVIFLGVKARSGAGIRRGALTDA